MQVKDARIASAGTSGTMFLFAIVAGCSVVGLFTVSENVLLNVGICLVMLFIFIFLMVRDSKKLDEKITRYIEPSERGFECRTCKAKIGSPVKFKRVDEQPVLYCCEPCQTLWFVGSYSQMT